MHRNNAASRLYIDVARVWLKSQSHFFSSSQKAVECVGILCTRVGTMVDHKISHFRVSAWSCAHNNLRGCWSECSYLTGMENSSFVSLWRIVILPVDIKECKNCDALAIDTGTHREMHTLQFVQMIYVSRCWFYSPRGFFSALLCINLTIEKKIYYSHKVRIIQLSVVDFLYSSFVLNR